MNKTWVKVKRGLLEPKHREELGIRIWLYLYILDNANWEDGIIYDWKDENAAQELSMPKSTIRSQRLGLQESGYISCEKKQYSQKIIIHNWTNPKKYDGTVLNKREEEDEFQSDENLSLSGKEPKSDNQSDNQSDRQPYRKPITPTYYSQITNHKSREAWEKICEIKNVSGDSFYTLLSSTQQINIIPLLDSNPKKCITIAEYYGNLGKTFIQMVGMVINKFDTWREDKNASTGYDIDLAN